jgi:Mn2+/Fe2+ NRAMP family transporter
MALMATLPSSGSSLSSLSSSTSSAIALSDIFVGTIITICVLLFVLAVYDVMLKGDSRHTNTTAALQAICAPLIVTFCAWLMFEVAARL